MRQKFVIGNWKMNGSLVSITSLVEEILELLPNELHKYCAVLPPVIYLPIVHQLLADKSIGLGAQNVYPALHGAYTGEIAVTMLLDYACRYVLVGHSERRHLFHESEKFIAEKFHQVKDHGMIPVLCVGETLSEYENGLTKQVITKQLETVVEIKSSHEDVFKNCIVAYEPVWAIGTGKTAEPMQVQEVHTFIRQSLIKYGTKNADDLPILYGGSVNEKNAAALFAMPDVDGGLIGGASLHAKQFVEIVKCINCY